MGKTNRKKFGELLDDLGKRHTDPDIDDDKENTERWSEDGHAVKEVWDCTPDVVEIE